MIEDLIQDLIDRLDNRYHGKFRGYVHEVADPENRGRIRAIVPRLLGESTPTNWAMPAVPYAGPDQGFFTVPDLGSGVWIEFEEGDLSRPIWTGQWWGSPDEGDVGGENSTAMRSAPVAEQVRPLNAPDDWTTPPRQPETPQHEYPRQTATPKVRMLKSATGHHIVLDDRPDHERIEIHDSQGNRIILSRDGMERIISNERTFNKGGRSTDIFGNDETTIDGSQSETVNQGAARTVGGDATVRVSGDFSEHIGPGPIEVRREYAEGRRYSRTVDASGTAITVSGAKTESIRGSSERRVGGAMTEQALGGYSISSGGSASITSAGPIKLNPAIADLSLSAFAVTAGLGNISLNTKLGIMQLGGLSAVSPLVLGDGLMIHLTMLAQILKAVNPLTVAAYGPALDVWAAMTPVLDLSYFGFVKRFPVG